jgi:hypothetical protein
MDVNISNVSFLFWKFVSCNFWYQIHQKSDYFSIARIMERWSDQVYLLSLTIMFFNKERGREWLKIWRYEDVFKSLTSVKVVDKKRKRLVCEIIKSGSKQHFTNPTRTRHHTSPIMLIIS